MIYKILNSIFLNKRKLNKSNDTYYCYRCDSILTSENQSKEHIILNSCGGKLKSSKLLCIDCNSILGNILDSDLAEDGNMFMNLLLAKRERGEIQKIEGILRLTGEPAVFNNDGTIKYAHPIVNTDPENFLIKVNTIEQYSKIIKNLKKRIPKLDEEAMAKNLIWTKMPKEFTWVMKWSGTNIFPAIMKMMIGYYLHENGEAKFIKHLLPFIQKEETYQKMTYHLTHIPVYIPGNNEVSNIIKIIGNPKTQLLYAYMELFNFYPVIALLNDQYTGPKFNAEYGINVLSGKEFKPKINLSLNRQFFNEIDNENKQKTEVPIERINYRVDRILSVIAKRHIEKDVQNKVNEILDKYDVNYSDGKIPKDILSEIEEAISSLTFKFEYGHLGTEAPPTNRKEKDKWLINKLSEVNRDK